MHEVSICQGVINSLEEEMEEEKLEQVREIHLKVGVLSCVDPSILKHVYTFMIVDMPLQHSVLETQLVDVLAECKPCGKEFKVDKYKFVCPECGLPLSKIIEGNELQIHKIVFEEPVYENTE